MSDQWKKPIFKGKTWQYCNKRGGLMLAGSTGSGIGPTGP